MPSYYHIEKLDSIQTNGKWIPDTTYHRIADLQLTNQLGHIVSLNEDLKGKMLLIDFFFVNCTTSCPVLTRNMILVQRAFKPTVMRQNDTLVQFISITVNPERDSFPALRNYADRYHANHDHWWFLTGDKKTIYNFARNELQLATGPGDGGADDFIHTEKLVLIDKDRYIRGYYNGTDSSDVARCANDIGLLVLEKKKKKK